jgi:hypothetical protein
MIVVLALTWECWLVSAKPYDGAWRRADFRCCVNFRERASAQRKRGRKKAPFPIIVFLPVGLADLVIEPEAMWFFATRQHPNRRVSITFQRSQTRQKMPRPKARPV